MDPTRRSGGLPTAVSPTAVSAAAWHSELGGEGPDGRAVTHAGFAIREFTETPRAIDQPVLADDIFCLHRGGTKRVQRGHGPSISSYDVDCGALTVMPRGQCNRWLTLGPIDYVHLTLDTDLVAVVVREEFSCDREDLEFCDDVGFRDPLVEALFGELLLCACCPPNSRLYVDSILAVIAGRLLLTRSTLSARRLSAHRQSALSTIKGGLPDWRLRRVADFMHEHLADDISLEELGGLAGLSRAQFFRAFRQSTGTTPSRYFADLRIERARELVSGGLKLDEVARATGFTTLGSLNAAFQRSYGQTPKQFCRNCK